jgi:hypothetical protein
MYISYAHYHIILTCHAFTCLLPLFAYIHHAHTKHANALIPKKA